jgi:hypothetical protein
MLLYLLPIEMRIILANKLAEREFWCFHYPTQDISRRSENFRN